jgi:hypothetical protein
MHPSPFEGFFFLLAFFLSILFSMAGSSTFFS